jgi:hypothetical protein
MILRDDRALVMAGTRTYRPESAHVKVEPNSREGKALRLDEPTCFYAQGSVCMAKVTSLRCREGTCPPELFARLQTLIGL